MPQKTSTGYKISSKELVRGKHLRQLVLLFGTKLATISCAFGLSSKRWYEFEDETPLITRNSLFTRLLTNHPNLNPFNTTFLEVHEAIQAIDPDFTEEMLAIVVGLDAVACARLKQNNSMSPTVASYLLLMRNELRFRDYEESIEFLELIKQNARDEAEARKLDEEMMWKYGGWTRFAANPEIPRETRGKSSSEDNE